MNDSRSWVRRLVHRNNGLVALSYSRALSVRMWKRAELSAWFWLKYLMYNECFSHISKTLKEDISFSRKVQMVQAKSEYVSQYTCFQPQFSVKYKIWKRWKWNNHYRTIHTHISNRKRWLTIFQVAMTS